MLQNTRQHTRRRRRERIWGTREQDRDHEESDKLERSITKRRWLYEHDLYAKVRNVLYVALLSDLL